MSGYPLLFSASGINFYSKTPKSKAVIEYDLDLAETIISHNTVLSYYESTKFFDGLNVIIRDDDVWSSHDRKVYGITLSGDMIVIDMHCKALAHEMFHVYETRQGEYAKTMDHSGWSDAGWMHQISFYLKDRRDCEIE